MVNIIVHCRHCAGENLVKNGFAPNGKQKYLCRDCDRQSRENPGSNAYSTERREEILRAYQERSSLRGLRRTFGVSPTTVLAWLKKTPVAAAAVANARAQPAGRRSGTR